MHINLLGCKVFVKSKDKMRFMLTNFIWYQSEKCYQKKLIRSCKGNTSYTDKKYYRKVL